MNVSDGVLIFVFLFIGGDDPGCTEAADGNNDGAVDMSDGSSILNWLFHGRSGL